MRDLGTSLTITLFTPTYMGHNSECSMYSVKVRKLLISRIYPSFLSDIFDVTIPFIILMFLIENPLKEKHQT